MKQMKILLLLFVFLSNTCLANDPDNAYLRVGDTAKFDGILFPIPRAQRIELLTIDFSTCTKRLELSNQNETIYEKRVTNLETINTALRDENSRHNSTLTQFGMFFAGVATAVLTAWAISRATR